MSILISCEMGGDRVPLWLVRESLAAPQPNSGCDEFTGVSLERRAQTALNSIQFVPGKLPERLSGDAAAKYVARRMAAMLQVPLIENKYSADLIDVTRSARHRSVMPSAVRQWDSEKRDRLLTEVHAEYRSGIQRAIQQQSRQHGFTIHLSVRSFASLSDGRQRRTDVGLLYDPSREDELAFCLDWMDEMYESVPMIRVRRNYPRRGTTESLVTAMRSHFPADRYIGVELLVNRAWAGRRVSLRDQAIEGICKSLNDVLEFQTADAA
ncbi:N-formylglutamate amidohydrolase [Novipirellula sp. SH528]|uniref:N-formylglutamate amidohydrolase n=1 Tax=Novipirellula sp. SH528 TaxID=3454466 RepID=UPI003FA06CCA